MKRFLATTKVKVMIGLLCLFGLAMLAASASAETFHFTITSDQRGHYTKSSTVYQAIKAIPAVNGPGVFHISCGDIDDENAPGLTNNRGLINTYFGSSFPWFMAVSNHEAEDNATDGDMNWIRTEYTDGHNGRTPLKNIYNANDGPNGCSNTTYSWNYENAHFIMLNVYWDGNGMTDANANGGHITPALLTWLTNDLAATNKPFIFIFMHEPAFPYNHHYSDSLDQWSAQRDAFWQLLESEKVTAVFNGHTHYYSKHQGGGGPAAQGYPAHTYNYPNHNSWRTQDPAKAGLYGNVWQIDVGNGGYTPGGVDAGPIEPPTQPNDWLPTSNPNMQYNGLTFIDVNVTEDFAYINVYRDINDTGLQFEKAETITINGDFTAYNDCVFDPYLINYATDPCGVRVAYGDTTHITAYGTGNISTDKQNPDANYISSGYLRDSNTGAYTNVYCTMSSSGSPIWQPMVGCSGTTCWSGGYPCAPGTDANNTFGGIADITGVIYYGSTGWYVDVDLSGLDPAKTYTFATTASRAEPNYDDPVGHPTNQRWSIYTISGIDGATNASTSGVTEVNNFSVKFNTGNNHTKGYVARWTGINPGSDGAFKVRATADANSESGYKAYAPSVFMLKEEPMVPDNEPPTPNPMTWSSVPAATSPTTITMTATTATDSNYSVEYYFECTTDGSKSSAWQPSTTYVATGLNPSTSYTFRVKAHDTSSNHNETGWSTQQSATTPAMPPPGAATSPSPGIGATGVVITTDLSWTAGPNATSHDVYFGTTSPGTFQGNRTTTTFDTGTMDYNTTYYWRIDEKNAGGTTTGTVWSFTTAAPSAPTFIAAGAAVSGTGAVSPVWPAHQANDIGIMVIETGGEGTTLTPSGWTHITGSPVIDVASTAGSKLNILWKRAASSSEASVSTGDSGDHQVARIYTFRGVIKTGDPWNVVATGTKTTASTTATAVSVTTTVANTLVLLIVGRPNDSSSTTHFGDFINANLTSITERGEAGTSSGHGGGFVLTTGDKATTGVTGTSTSTKIASTTDTYMSIALKPGTPPKQATNPTPTNGATNVGQTQDLSWTAGSGATTRDVYFGTVNPPVTKVISNGTALTYDTGTMANNTTYYWRVDEKNTDGNTTGMVWNFTTIVAAPGQATNSTPANGATDVNITTDLDWMPGSGAATRDVYFGTIDPPVTKVIADGTTVIYDTGTMANNMTYYWRVDEKNAGGTTTGTVWSFTTASPPVTARTLTVATSAGGTVTQPGLGDFNYPDGNTVNLVASAYTGYHFVSWTGDTNTIANVNSAVTTITIDANYSIQANFAVTQYTISGNTGVGEVTLGGLGVVSDGDGNYTKTVDYGWSGTVTPTKAGYTFAPVSRTYTSVAEDHVGDNYAATLNTYTISGNTGVGEVTLGGLGVASDSDGNYTKTVDYGWSGTVTPTKAGYTFAPVSRTYTSVAENHVGDNYAATLNTYTISGNTGVADVNLEGLGVVSDGDGNYTKTVDYGWSGTVTPTKAGYTFAPVSRTYTSVAENHVGDNYVATLNTYTISGNAGIDGAVMNGLPNAPVSGPSGDYNDIVDYNWSGTVTPAKAGYTFSPASKDYSNVTSDQLNQDYTATLNTYTISGYIENECNEPIEGVLVDANNGGGEDTTDVNGFYEVGVDYNWSGTVTPSKAQYTFEPNLMSYVNVTADQLDQNYTAHDIYDLDYDCYIGWGDVVVIHDNWLQPGEDIPGDFSGDETVNFLDFADFALVWQANE